MTKQGNYHTGPRPHVWQTGPDPQRHAMHNAWARSRAQAHFRGEIWNLTFEQYESVWGSRWPERSRHRDGIMLMKKNWRKPWNIRNVELVDRVTFHLRQAQIKQDRKKERLNDNKI